MPIRFVENPKIDQYYQSARHMDVVGIACRDFLAKLCPMYHERTLALSPSSRKRRLQKLHNSPLFKNLKRGLTISVSFVNPYCEYAKQRTREEHDNPEGRLHILQGIHAVRTLFEDLESELKQKPRVWNISGAVNISLLKTNPYVSYTWVEQNLPPSEKLFIGFLLRKRLGIKSPRLMIENEGDVFRAFQTHFDHLEHDTLFRWEGENVAFNDKYLESGRYDVFLCHNHLDRPSVRQISGQLQKRGFLPWLDESAIHPGSKWQKEIEDALRKVRCTIVCFGPNGLGTWQQMEIFGALNRAVQEGMTILPVILEGVKGTPDFDGSLLKQFQWTDFRKSKRQAFEKLCREIKKANEM